MSYTDIEIELEFSNYNGSMSVVITDADSTIASLTDVEDRFVTVKHQIHLPNKLVFAVSNKNYATDTLVDNTNDAILADKYVRLNQLTIGRMTINSEKFYNICSYVNDRNEHVTHDPFWAFNGVVTIDLFESNFIKYLFLINNKFKHK
jgi:hypothetical protein